MADLYNRQAQGLSTINPIVQKVDTSASEILSERAEKTAKIAGENFVLGQKQVLSSVLDYGYQQAQDNPTQFLEITNSIFEKQIEGLPETMKETMASNFVATQKNILLKVENNFTAKQDAQLKENSLLILQDTEKNIKIANENLYSALASGREEDILIAKQSIDNFKRQASKHSELKTSDGSYVYGKEDREKIKAGNIYDAQPDFEYAVDGLSLEKLREWDKTVFQNQEKWMQQTGIDKKTYNSQSKYIKERLKELGDDNEREVKTRAYFAAAEFIADFNPDEFSELESKGLVNSDLLEAIKTVWTKPKSVSEVVNAYKFLDTLKKLENILSDTDESEDGNSRRFGEATKLLKDYKNFADSAGLDIKEQEDYLITISKALVDKQFSEALQPIYSDNALSEKFFTVKQYLETGRTRGKENVIDYAKDKLYQLTSGEFNIKGKQKVSELYADKKAYSAASKIIKNALLSAISGDYDTAKKILENGNREVIKIKNSPYISREEFNRLESDLENNKKAYFTTSFGGTYEFMGYSNKDAIFKAVR